jgi:hypothetical protein
MKHFVLSCAGSLFLALASVTYAADTPAEATVNPTPEAAATSPADVAVNSGSETMANPPTNAAANPQLEQTTSLPGETPADAKVSSMSPTPAEGMATGACAVRAAAGSLDCEKLKRRVSTEKAASGTALACTSHLDPKGNVVYDDPTCPSRIRPVVTDAGSIYLIKENPFFNLHIEKAVNQAGAAEIAGHQGQAVEMMDHAQMSLMRAREAQRAGNVPGLNEGIISLTEALRLPEGSSVREATVYIRDARKHLSQAGGIKYKEVQPQGVVAANREEPK